MLVRVGIGTGKKQSKKGRDQVNTLDGKQTFDAVITVFWPDHISCMGNRTSVRVPRRRWNDKVMHARRLANVLIERIAPHKSRFKLSATSSVLYLRRSVQEYM